jgi:biotin-(acetyl-CoA carboxylase) ligase
VYKRAVVPLDGSPAAEAIIPFILEIAGPLDLEVVLLEYLILGVAVNLNVDVESLRRALGPAGLAATSLAAALGHEVDRNVFAASYLNHLDRWARRYRDEGAAPILAAWRDRDILTGRRVEVRGDSHAFDGRALGVDAEGHLVVRDSHGARRTVLTEEVRVLD